MILVRLFILLGFSEDKKQLTTKEANESRFVTKCRWVIEAVNGQLKQFKALNSIQNHHIPHIMDDFKIAAALTNRFSERLVSDEEDWNIITENMLKQFDEPNKVERIVSRYKLNNEDRLNLIDAVEIQDFPKLDLQSIKRYLTLGNYQLNQTFGYLAEHFKINGRYKMYMKKEDICNLDGINLVKAKIQSKHVNRTEYSIYVTYEPNQNDHCGVDGWYCTCRNGRRTVGCCSHVATVIYYLSCGKYEENLPQPACRLTSCLKNFDDSDESDLNDENDNKTDSLILNMAPSESSSEELNAFTEKNKELKHSLTLDQISQKKTKFEGSIEIMNLIKENIPMWGGKIDSDNSTVNKLKIINTCTFDYHLFGLWVASKLSVSLMSELNDFINTNNMATNNISKMDIMNLLIKIVDIVKLINESEWNKAKTIWILQVNKLSPLRRTFNTFGSEYEFFINHVRQLQRYRYFCANCNQYFYENFDLEVSKDLNNNIVYSYEILKDCKYCKTKDNVKIVFEYPLFWFYLQVDLKNKQSISIFDFPLQKELNVKKYKLLYGTFYSNNTKEHFQSVFFLKNEYFLLTI